MRASQRWQKLVSGGVDTTDYPLSCSPEQVNGCIRLEAEKRLADEDMEKSRNCLCVSADGWVPPER